jgi:hypothetical protein
MLFSLIMLLTITLTGIDTAAAAVPAAMFTALQPQIQNLLHVANASFILVGLGAISLGRNPGGLTSQLNDAVDIARGLRQRLTTIGEGPRRSALDSPFLVAEGRRPPIQTATNVAEDSYAG